MTTPRDDRDLDALLRQPSERLAPPEGSWELVTRRARRRKWAKASASVAAGVIVAAGAVPAVIAVRHNSDDQSISIATNTSNPPSTGTSGPFTPAPVPDTAPAVPTSLVGFVPASLSFVSQDDGWLWGSTGSSSAGVVALTTDDGAHWTKLPAPPVKNTLGADGASQIRFGNAANNVKVGFVFGGKYFVSEDGGSNWTQYTSNGYIDDLETMHGQVWALIRPHKLSATVRLYSATLADPTLRPVSGVPPMSGASGADSIAVNGTSVDVIVGSSSFYTSPGGLRWLPGKDPCRTQAGLGEVETARLTTQNLGGVVAACGYDQSATTQDKRVFVTANAGKRWAPTKGNPLPSGWLENIAAGGSGGLVIGTSEGAQITPDGGSSWQPVSANGAELGFVGFIDVRHLVAIAAPSSPGGGAFTTSKDAGTSWITTPFAK